MPARCFLALLLCLPLCVAAVGLRADTVPVNSAAALPEAIAEAITAATGGTVLLLAAGDYGRLDLNGLVMPADQPLVLRGDAGGGTVITGMMLRDVQNLVLENIRFDYTFTPGDSPRLRVFQVNDSQGITIRNAVFDGDVARGISAVSDGFGTAFGLNLRGSSRVTVEHTEIRGFYRGLTVSRCQDITIRGNDVHDIRMDGMNFAQITGGVIEANYIHDFNRSLASRDHADMIQFWTEDTTAPSRDIVIRNNVLSSGAGWYTQSIFMRNERVDKGEAGPEMYYQNILITQNVIINAHLHGISIGASNGLTISNNTVIRNARSEGERNNVLLWTPRINVAPRSQRVQILRNVTSRIDGYENQNDWTVTDNLLVQDRGQAQSGVFYDAAFADARAGDPQDLASFSYRTGGPLDRTGLGADRLDTPYPALPVVR